MANNTDANRLLIEQQLCRLPDPVRSKALHNFRLYPLSDKVIDCSPPITLPCQAIEWGFDWNKTTEGRQYWAQQADKYNYHFFNTP